MAQHSPQLVHVSSMGIGHTRNMKPRGFNGPQPTSSPTVGMMQQIGCREEKLVLWNKKGSAPVFWPRENKETPMSPNPQCLVSQVPQAPPSPNFFGGRVIAQQPVVAETAQPLGMDGRRWSGLNKTPLRPDLAVQAPTAPVPSIPRQTGQNGRSMSTCSVISDTQEQGGSFDLQDPASLDTEADEQAALESRVAQAAAEERRMEAQQAEAEARMEADARAREAQVEAKRQAQQAERDAQADAEARAREQAEEAVRPIPSRPPDH